LQPTSATVSAKLTSASTTCRAVFSTTSSFSNPIYSNFGTANSANNFMAKMNVAGLTPNTQYFYAVESNGVLDASSEDIGTLIAFSISGASTSPFNTSKSSKFKTKVSNSYSLVGFL
jgi:phosphodiesterase/alkaline phosphatase D-like protein